MCEAEGMGLAPWGALGGGNFKNEEQRASNEGRKMGGMGPSEKDIKVSEVLEKVAKSKGTAITSIALAYVMHKTPNVFPIVGGRKIEHLKGNIEALKIKLSQEEMDEIDEAYPFDIGFPMGFLFMGQKYHTRLGAPDVTLTKMNGHIQVPEKQGVCTSSFFLNEELILGIGLLTFFSLFLHTLSGKKRALDLANLKSKRVCKNMSMSISS